MGIVYESDTSPRVVHVMCLSRRITSVPSEKEGRGRSLFYFADESEN